MAEAEEDSRDDGSDFVAGPRAVSAARARMTWAVLGYGLLGVVAYTLLRSYLPREVLKVTPPAFTGFSEPTHARSVLPGYVLEMLVFQIPLVCGLCLWFWRRRVKPGMATLLFTVAAVALGMVLHIALPVFYGDAAAEKVWAGFGLYRKGPLAESLYYAMVALPWWVAVARWRAAPAPPIDRGISLASLVRRRRLIAVATLSLVVLQFVGYERWGTASKPCAAVSNLPKRPGSEPVFVLAGIFAEGQHAALEQALRRRFPGVRVEMDRSIDGPVRRWVTWQETDSGAFWFSAYLNYCEGVRYLNTTYSVGGNATYVWVFGGWVHVWTERPRY